MSDFNLDILLKDLERASAEPDAKTKVVVLMEQALKNPEKVTENMPDFSDDIPLFESDDITIWPWRAPSAMMIPPHDHQMTAIVGVYEGAEENRFYVPENGKLVHMATRIVKAGEVIVIDGDSIHSVHAIDLQPCSAIHVYLGKLNSVQRSLFDWETGEARPFTDENYFAAMKGIT